MGKITVWAGQTIGRRRRRVTTSHGFPDIPNTTKLCVRVRESVAMLLNICACVGVSVQPDWLFVS